MMKIHWLLICAAFLTLGCYRPPMKFTAAPDDRAAYRETPSHATYGSDSATAPATVDRGESSTPVASPVPQSFVGGQREGHGGVSGGHTSGADSGYAASSPAEGGDYRYGQGAYGGSDPGVHAGEVYGSNNYGVAAKTTPGANPVTEFNGAQPENGAVADSWQFDGYRAPLAVPSNAGGGSDTSIGWPEDLKSPATPPDDAAAPRSDYSMPLPVMAADDEWTSDGRIAAAEPTHIGTPLNDNTDSIDSHETGASSGWPQPADSTRSSDAWPGSGETAAWPTMSDLPKERFETAVPVAKSAAPEPPVENSEVKDLFAEIDRKLNSLPLGNIAFNTPEGIPLGRVGKVDLLVSLQEAERVLRRAVRAPGPVETARVRIAPLMEATLTGVGFRIESTTPAWQPVSPSERTEWQWQIEPTKADTLDLTLTLTALFEVNGKERTRAIRTFQRTISVDVPISYQVAQFLGNHISWIVPALLVPLIGAVYRRRLGRRTRQSSRNQRNK